MRGGLTITGLRDSIGGDLAYDDLSWQYYGLRALFNLLFFIIVNTLLMNVVFGIIVDTFSELRDEKFQTEDQMKNYCFICSLRSFDFQKAGTVFTPFLWCFFRSLQALDCVGTADVPVRAPASMRLGPLRNAV